MHILGTDHSIEGWKDVSSSTDPNCWTLSPPGEGKVGRYELLCIGGMDGIKKVYKYFWCCSCFVAL